MDTDRIIALMKENVSLTAKLAEVMGEMAHIPKEGFNASQKYKFVRETDVAETLTRKWELSRTLKTLIRPGPMA